MEKEWRFSYLAERIFEPCEPLSENPLLLNTDNGSCHNDRQVNRLAHAVPNLKAKKLQPLERNLMKDFNGAKFRNFSS